MFGRPSATLPGGRLRTSTVVLSLLFVATLILYLLVRPVPVTSQGSQGGSAPQSTTTAPATTSTAAKTTPTTRTTTTSTAAKKSSTTQTTTSSGSEDDLGLRYGEFEHSSSELNRLDDELDHPGTTAGRDGDRDYVTLMIRLRS